MNMNLKKLFQFLMVRLKEVISAFQKEIRRFQFLMVRLKENRKTLAFIDTMFQFLMVRLKVFSGSCFHQF